MADPKPISAADALAIKAALLTAVRNGQQINGANAKPTAAALVEAFREVDAATCAVDDAMKRLRNKTDALLGGVFGPMAFTPEPARDKEAFFSTPKPSPVEYQVGDAVLVPFKHAEDVVVGVVTGHSEGLGHSVMVHDGSRGVNVSLWCRFKKLKPFPPLRKETA